MMLIKALDGAHYEFQGDQNVHDPANVLNIFGAKFGNDITIHYSVVKILHTNFQVFCTKSREKCLVKNCVI